VVLEAAEDAQGTAKNKVVKVKPPRKGRIQTVDLEKDSHGPKGELVKIPL
jgi:hypothetical protein